MNQSPVTMISVNDSISDMIEHVDIMIDSADTYCETRSGLIVANHGVSPSGYAYAHHDIDNILQAAAKCIEIIDHHNNVYNDTMT